MPPIMLDYIFPPRCLLCHAAGGIFCAACRQALPPLPPACFQCAAPLAAPGGVCGRCQQGRPHYAHTVAAFAYQAPLDHLVHDWKYRGRSFHTDALAAAWLERLAAPPPRPEALLPVPLHWRRLLSRGFNQAGLLAASWGKRLAIPVLHHHARRVRATGKQASLDVQERRRNLNDAFRMKKHPYRHVAIVDDVMTTGSTVDAFARAVLAAGAERVDVWVLARALP